MSHVAMQEQVLALLTSAGVEWHSQCIAGKRVDAARPLAPLQEVLGGSGMPGHQYNFFYRSHAVL